MKRLLTVLISFSVLATLFCLKTFAEEEDKYYSIFMQEDLYVLTVCENGTEYELHQGSLNEVIALIDSACESAKIIFDDVKTDQNITFPYI